MLLNFKGRWNAVTNVANLTTGINIPNALADGIGTIGDSYIIYADQSPTHANIYNRNLGSGNKSWIALSYIFYNGSTWEMTGDPGGGSGTVTSVDLTMPAAFTVSGNPITTAGTLIVSANGTSGQYIRGDGTLGTFTATSGITSINSLTAASQILVTGNTGTNFNIVSSGSTHTFNLPIATSGTTGKLTGADWLTFYNKGPGTVTSIGMTVPSAFNVSPSSISTSGTFAITATGTTAQYIRGDGSLATFPVTTSGITSINGLTTAAQILVTGSTGTNFNIVSSGSTHTFNLPVATSGSTGKLTSADWITFSSKGNGTVTSVASSDSSLTVTSGTTAADAIINLAHTNIFSATQAVSASGTTNTIVDRFTLITPTAATALATQQFSPALVFTGQGWKSNATAVSQSVEFRIYNTPITGATAATGRLFVAPYVNGSIPLGSAETYFDSRGNMTINKKFIGQPPAAANNSNTSLVIGGGVASNVTGAGNIVIGDGAATNLTTGTGCTIVGNQAGPVQATAATASDNICIGNRAGNLLQGGATNNIIISSGTTPGAATISTGTGNVVIGNYAIPTSGRTANNQIFLSDGGANLRYMVSTGGNTLINTIIDDGNNTLQVSGSLQSQGIVHNTVTKTAAYTATKTDCTIRVDTSTSGVTITLPTTGITTGQIFIIKKLVAANTVAISCTANIDGAGSQTLTTQYSVLRVQWAGSTYDTI